MSLPSLYVISAEYQSAVAQLADLDLDEQTFADTLESLSGDLEAKAKNVAMFALELEASAKARREAAAGMMTLAGKEEAQATRLREYLKLCMVSTKMPKIDCVYFILSIRNNPPKVIIDEPSMIPTKFMRQPEPPPLQIDKKAIAQAITDGREVSGAHIERGQRLEIR